MAAGEGVRGDEIGRSGSVADPNLAAAVEDVFLGPLDSELEVASPRPLSGRAEEFAGFYIRYRYTLVRHAERYLHDRRDVEEVVQETFLKLFLALSDLDDEVQAIQFCRRVLTNLCIDRYRERSRRPALVGLEDDDDCTGDDTEFDTVVAAEDAALVREALALLSPLQRAALVKREIEEKPLPQIAAELGVPAENMKYVLHRARQALRKLLVGNSASPGGSGSGGKPTIGAGGRLGSNVGVVLILIVIALAVIPRTVPNKVVLDGRSGAVGTTATSSAGATSLGSSKIDPGRSTGAGHSRSSSGSKPSGSHSSGSGAGSQPGSGSQQGNTGSGQGGTHHHSGGGHHGGGHHGGGHHGGGHHGGHSGPPAKVVCKGTCASLKGSASVKVTGPTTLTTLRPTAGAGYTTSASTVVAPTNLGNFTVAQTIKTSSSGDVGASFAASLQTSSGPGETFGLAGGTAQVMWLLNGRIEVHASAQVLAPPTGSQSAPQMQSFQVVLVYSSWKMTSIVKEVITAPMSVPSGGSGGSSAPGAAADHADSGAALVAARFPFVKTREVVRSGAI